MRRVLFAAASLLVASAFIYGCIDTKGPLGPGSSGGSWSRVSGSITEPAYGQAVDLIAGGSTVMGSVRCWIKGDILHVRYSAAGDWTITATHLYVASSLGQLPLAADKNPILGRFPFKGQLVPRGAEYEYSLKLTELGLDHAATLIVAAHANVKLRPSPGHPGREEGAWGNGYSISQSVPGGANAVDLGYMKGDIRIEDGTETSNGLGSGGMYFTLDPFSITVNEGLRINEIYYAGSCASSFYFYDQFVELYNNSEDTLYLDGMIVTRQLSTVDPSMEDVDYVRAIYAFQFPGTPVTGREHPVAPGQFVVIAADAIDHRPFCPSAVDLSTADWEMFNALGNDYDNPSVPNLVNIMPNRTSDYMINLVHNAVVLANGSEHSMDADGYLRIPIRAIVDGVEYSSNAAVSKEMTIRVDAGFAGIGITRYAGYSTERKVPGLDTNNSTVDFVVILHPTPGYQHAGSLMFVRPGSN